MKRLSAGVFVLFVSVFMLAQSALAQTTELTYQGQLQASALPASGNFDFEFLLFDAVAGGSQVGATIPRSGVAVANGIFGVNLDFGSSFPGASRFLEIRVRQSGGGGFTTLSPRQPLTSAPYSVKSLSSESATNATTAGNFTGSLTGDVTGTQSVTTVARLQGRNVSAAAPLNDQVLKFNSGANQWQPAADNTGAGGGVASVTATGPLASSGGATPNISLGQVPTANIADAAVTAPKIATGQVVKSVNTLKDDVTLAAGANITITPSGNTLTIASTGGSGGNPILNQTTQQAGANFNISGTGTANILNAGTQFNIGGNRVLGVAGIGNLFAGLSAGAANPTGNENSFFGTQSGFSNTTGSNNVFVGTGAGLLNTTGASNSFVGEFAGLDNTTGTNNTLLGANTIVSNGSLTFATAIGSGAIVPTSNTVVLGRAADTVQVPGNLNVAGTFTGNINGASITNLNASNIATGTLNNARLGVIPVANGGTGSATQNFVDLTTAQTVAGNKTFSGTLSGNIVNAATQYNIGGTKIFSNEGTNNLIAGVSAGSLLTTGSGNSFFGRIAGQFNTTGGSNSYFGFDSGPANSTGGGNSFFGAGSGHFNTASSNSFFGSTAGFANTLGSSNSFFGISAGNANTTGNSNTIIGANADVGVGNLSFATAIGSGAVVSASNTVVLGRAVDTVQVPGTALDVNGPVTSTRTSVAQQSIEINGGNSSSIRLTAQSAAAADKPLVIQNLSAEAAPTTNNNIQFQVGTTASPSTKMTIDASGDVGIGTTTPNDRLEVNGSIRVTTLGAAGATTLCRNASNQISTCSSSARYKSNITPFGYGLSLVKQLRPVSFTWKDGGMLDMGLVAEEVNAVEPLLTNLNDKGQVEGVKYDRVGVILINAVKEQQTQIEEQRKLIDQQRAENEALKARILAIEKALAKRP